MTEDNQSPLSLSEAVQAYTKDNGDRNPDNQDNPPEDQDEGQDAPDDDVSDDDLAEGLTEEDEDNPETETDEGPEEAEEPEIEPYAKGRFAADDARVKLDDGTTVTIADLKKGTLLQSDYTKKTMAVAEERKAVEHYKAQVASVEQALAQERETVALIVRAYLPTPPDPAMLNPESGVFDFLGYQTQKEEYERKSGHIQQMIHQHQQMLARQAAEAEQSRRQLRDMEAGLMYEKMPELKSPGEYEKFWARMVQYAAKKGFSPEEVDDVDDHRTYDVLRDAMAFQDLKDKVKAARLKTDGKPPLLQGSARRSPDVVRARDANAALARLNKSGSIKDGVAAYLAREKVR